MALAKAKLSVEEGAYAFITGRRQDKLDEAVKLIGHKAIGVHGDAANLANLDCLYETMKREKCHIERSPDRRRSRKLAWRTKP